jgi:hypothetical protein
MAASRSASYPHILMSSPANVSGRRFRLHPEALDPLAAVKHPMYVAARPFPHVVIDGLFPEEVLRRVLAEFPEPHGPEWRAFDSPLERKLATNDGWNVGDVTGQLLAELNSAAMIDFLEELTGLRGLVPDPHFIGGGLHQIEPGGHLQVHADFNRHPRTGLDRRLNLLLYLNEDWEEEYEGALELWDRRMRRCEVKIPPLFNRCVVFSTTRTSFHGHPEPLRCPEGRTRKSVACYYYSRADLRASLRGAHSTLFQARPGHDLPAEGLPPSPLEVIRARLRSEIARLPAPPWRTTGK